MDIQGGNPRTLQLITNTLFLLLNMTWALDTQRMSDKRVSPTGRELPFSWPGLLVPSSRSSCARPAGVGKSLSDSLTLSLCTTGQCVFHFRIPPTLRTGRWGSSWGQGRQSTVGQGTKANTAQRAVTFTRGCVCQKGMPQVEFWLPVAVHVCEPRTQEAEAEGWL